jgi:hypothetical protein
LDGRLISGDKSKIEYDDAKPHSALQDGEQLTRGVWRGKEAECAEGGAAGDHCLQKAVLGLGRPNQQRKAGFHNSKPHDDQQQDIKR